MTEPTEFRAVVEHVEFRGGKDGRLIAAGVAMKYGAKSKPIDGKFRETFAPGSFATTLSHPASTHPTGKPAVQAHYEHGGPFLGTTQNGTLRLTDSRSELAYEIDMPDTPNGREAAYFLERGDLTGSSIGFRAAPKGVAWSKDDDGMALRTVSEAVLFFCDLTTSPYYDDSTATVALRSFAETQGVELRSVLAADAATLAAYLDPKVDVPADALVEGRGTPTFARERISWLTC